MPLCYIDAFQLFPRLPKSIINGKSVINRTTPVLYHDSAVKLILLPLRTSVCVKIVSHSAFPHESKGRLGPLTKYFNKFQMAENMTLEELLVPPPFGVGQDMLDAWVRAVKPRQKEMDPEQKAVYIRVKQRANSKRKYDSVLENASPEEMVMIRKKQKDQSAVRKCEFFYTTAGGGGGAE